MHIGPRTQASQAASPKFGAVRYNNRAISALHHRPLGFDQKHVAVVKTPNVYSGNTQKSFLNGDRLEHLICKVSQRNAGPVVESSTEQDKIDRVTG